MTRGILISLLFFAATLQGAYAQQASPAKLNGTQLAGRELYNQHCGVCHTKPTILSPYYGPALSKDVVGSGNDDAMRQFISQGTDRMPGFRYSLGEPQINAIVQYLKTVPAPAATAPKPKTSGTNQREVD